MIIKFKANGEVEWGKSIGGSEWDEINCIVETHDKNGNPDGYIVGGNFDSDILEIEKGIKLENKAPRRSEMILD